MGSILDREKSMIQKLNQTNYEMFDGDREDAMDFIGDRMNAFVKYANVVIMEQVMSPIWHARYEGQELRDKIQAHDTKRKLSHDYAISSIDVLNRLSKNLGLEPFADVDTKDRYAVADFVGEFVNETYNKGIGKTLDSATFERTEQYEVNMKEELKKLDSSYNAMQQTGAQAEGPSMA